MLSPLIDQLGIDYTILWTWFLLFVRLGAVFISLPGIGTEQIPGKMRGAAAIMIALSLSIAGIEAAPPSNYVEGGLMVITEFILGYLMGFIPMLIVSGLAVAGQVATGAMGLGQANMIDPSLGGSVALLARFQSLFAILVFLLIDGHHVVIQAASTTVGDVGVGLFQPDERLVALLLDRFASTFELAVIVSAPVLVTLLVTQFVLGLITRFVPQVNIFIISLPLTIVVGLYITAYIFPGVAIELAREYATVQEQVTSLVSTR